MNEKKINFINYLYILVKWRKFIIINFLVVSIVTAAISLMLPKTYTAGTTILPPSDEGGGLGISDFIGNLPMAGFALGGVSEETYIVMAILNSRNVMESIVKRFDLMKVYEAENMELAVKMLRNNVHVEINENGTISLSTSAKTGYLSNDAEEDEARQRATDIANAFIEELDKMNIEKKTEKARNNRVYIEERYLQNLEDLRKAEEDLRVFQKENNVVALPEQMAASIEAAAQIVAVINSKEIELDVMRKSLGNTHPEIVRARNELAELKKKYDEMVSGKVMEKDASGELFIPFDDVPDVGVQYYRLYREVTLQEKLLEFILPQYEQAKIQEAKDTPTIQVLDEAVPPVLRSSPKRGILVILMAFMSIFVSLVIVLIIEYLNRLRYGDHERYSVLESALHELKGDYSRLTQRLRPGKSLPKGRLDE